MRVLHVTTDLGTYGAERVLALLLERFDEPGIELAALTVARRGPANGARVPVFDAARRGRFDAGFLARMVAAIRSWRPDVVHTHTHHGKYWGRLSAVIARVPLIVHTEHNSEFGAPSFYRAFDRALIRKTDAVVAFSPTHRDRLVREDGVPAERIAIIPNGIVLREHGPASRARARAALGAGDDERLLLHVGRLTAAKNQQLAIEALALLEPPARLVLVGDGVDRPALEALARARDVASRVTFLGYHDDAAALLAGADITLVTSLNEAMPLTVIEAMIAGSPLVSTPWNGAREMLGEGRYGIVVDDYAPAALAAAVRAIVDDPAAAAERTRLARDHARAEYDVATMARRHAELYRALSDGTRAASPRMTAVRS
ncbi:MAG TPA: glycosyltransferase [Candidatus Acidoferrum sp.]|nr:glycosyltransferase [Candidatus Acidoferrum sp.]